MIDMKTFCSSLSVSWIIRMLEANPDEDNGGTVTQIVP